MSLMVGTIDSWPWRGQCVGWVYSIRARETEGPNVDTVTVWLEESDVITYVESECAGDVTRVTHRVVGIETEDGIRQFQTKGDANEDPDRNVVSASAVIGVVQFHIPYIGYVIEFAETSTGLIILVILPAILLAVSEAYSFYTTVREQKRQT